MKRSVRLTIIIFVLLISLFLGAFTSRKSVNETNTAGFQSIVDSVFAQHPEMIGISIHIESPDKQISWSYAAGKDGKTSDKKLDAKQPVLIASTTKTYISAAILRLVENKKLTVDESIQNLITEQSKNALKNAGYHLDSIKVIHLLSHTSGIRDYVDDSYFEFIDKNKTYQWTREEQIARAASLGSPISSPGAGFKYADVNFVLLSEIIEHFTNEPFYKSVRKLLNYNKNHLNNTWFIQLENQPKKTMPLANQYMSEFSWEIKDLNPSWDLYGGGGIASNVEDMSRFFQLLFTGKIIKDKKVLQLMTTDVPPNLEINYCLGIRKIRSGAVLGYNHGGGLGTDVTYFPELNTTIAIASIEANKRDIALQIRDLLVARLKK